MNGMELLDKMSLIDARLIEGASEEKLRRTGMVLKYAVCAACACLLLAAVAVPLFTRTGERPAEEQPTRADDGFQIENGVLLSYTGAETTVVVPDEVTTIAAGAFAASPVAAEINVVVLGEHVERIDEAAFTGLASISEVEVAEGNEYYEFYGGLLTRSDHTIIFKVLNSKAAINTFSELMYNIERGKINSDTLTDFVIGNAVMKLSIVPNDPEIYAEYPYRCTMIGLTAYGQTVTFSEPVSLYGNFQISSFEVDDCVVVSKLNNSIGDTWILAKSGVYHPENAHRATDSETENNDSIFTFYPREDGTIGYRRTLRKYLPSQASGGEIQYCTGKDEFCREDGIVSLREGQIYYTPIKGYTADEIFDLEELFSMWRVTANIDVENLETLLAENALKYESGK